MIFVTSDQHFGHTDMLDFAHRPFDSVKQMDNALIRNWNSTVGVDDQVYILGDLTMNKQLDTSL